MAYLKRENPTILLPVVYDEPKDGGGFEKIEFQLRYRLLPEREFRGMMERGGDGQITDRDAVLALVADGPFDLTDEHGVAFTLDDILQRPGMAGRIIAIYRENWQDIVLKNLKAPERTG